MDKPRINFVDGDTSTYSQVGKEQRYVMLLALINRRAVELLSSNWIPICFLCHLGSDCSWRCANTCKARRLRSKGPHRRFCFVVELHKTYSNGPQSATCVWLNVWARRNAIICTSQQIEIVAFLTFSFADTTLEAHPVLICFLKWSRRNVAVCATCSVPRFLPMRLLSATRLTRRRTRLRILPSGKSWPITAANRCQVTDSVMQKSCQLCRVYKLLRCLPIS